MGKSSLRCATGQKPVLVFGVYKVHLLVTKMPSNTAVSWHLTDGGTYGAYAVGLTLVGRSNMLGGSAYFATS